MRDARFKAAPDVKRCSFALGRALITAGRFQAWLMRIAHFHIAHAAVEQEDGIVRSALTGRRLRYRSIHPCRQLLSRGLLDAATGA